jgi:alkanesulfonate monooxygenase SsuD/methylene tetrahydromethanopterin reductase-like flavin-dependent oxidoreductase (luciferase family)
MAPSDPILDPLVHLTLVAGVTERLELGTGILILPQRNPVVLAKQVASLDLLSGGRLLLGVAPGYLEAEMTAVGVDLPERGRRTDEYLDAMAALWAEPAQAYRGEYAAVARGHGWIGNGSSPDDLAGHLDGLEKAAEAVRRPPRLGRLEITFMQLDPVEVTPEAARRYADLGVDRLLVYPLPLDSADETLAFLEHHADLPHTRP